MPLDREVVKKLAIVTLHIYLSINEAMSGDLAEIGRPTQAAVELSWDPSSLFQFSGCGCYLLFLSSG
jgi:hypothetical protein